MMPHDSDLIEKLTTLNHIADTLNQAVDVRGVLDDALASLVGLMGLETGWIYLRDEEAESGYVLAAYHNLPPALEQHDREALQGSCTCQRLCNDADSCQAYNEVHCQRLQRAQGERRGLAMHASAPLRAGNRILGILNVAAPDWSSFSSEALSLLANVGGQMGVAVERAQLYDLLHERRLHEQATLLRLSNQLLGHLDVGDLIDYLVNEVKQILGADACALLLPGEGRGTLEFQAASGWRLDPVAQGRRVPANGHSGPGLVMRTQQVLQAEDILRHDPTPWWPDWLRDEGFRGHAVVPLVAAGRSVGALMVDSRQPRRLDDDEVRLLQLMANQAAMAIDKARLHDEELKAQAMEKELEVGQEIQLSLLPPAPPVVAGWEFAAFYQAARLVGGDFYDFFELPGENGGQSDRLGLVIADVAGKGVPAALFMARTCTAIRVTALNLEGPSAVLTEVDELIRKDRRCELFLTAFYAALDTRSGRLTYANGGHNPPLLWQAATGGIQRLAARGIVLGAIGGLDFEEREVDVAPGDYLVFYTDGVTEAMDADHRLFGEEQLQAVVTANAGASPGEMVNAIVTAVRAHAGGTPPSDDLTLFVGRRLPA